MASIQTAWTLYPLRHGGRRNPRGYALMAALIALVVVSMAAAVAVNRAQLDARREREEQLLWVGNQIRQALWRYSITLPPNGGTQYPLTLEDLLEDKRLAAPLRYLRQVYPDPFTGKADWVLELEGGRIVGVHSSSADAPLRHARYGPGNESFANARSYAEWRFLAANAAAANALAGGAGSASNGASNSTSGSGADGSNDPSAGEGAPPPAPSLAARSNCYQQFMAPRSQCTSTPPPMGDDLKSCMKSYAELYNACIAAISQ